MSISMAKSVANSNLLGNHYLLKKYSKFNTSTENANKILGWLSWHRSVSTVVSWEATVTPVELKKDRHWRHRWTL